MLQVQGAGTGAMFLLFWALNSAHGSHSPLHYRHCGIDEAPARICACCVFSVLRPSERERAQARGGKDHKMRQIRKQIVWPLLLLVSNSLPPMT